MTNVKSLDVVACRRQFPGLEKTIEGRPAVFFDGPGGSQVPARVINAMVTCLAQHNANEGGLFATSREVGTIVAAAHEAAADLLGCTDPDQIIFGANMTTLTFALSRSLARTWSRGDEIIVTRLDHEANVSPWLLAAQDAGVVVRFLDIDPTDCTLRLDELAQLLNAKTRLVAVGVASNAVGSINPVAEIATAAHQVGALVCLDAVHAVPHLLADVQAWGGDFVLCSPYKFFGPHLGILWGRRELLERLPAYKVRPAPDNLPGRWMTGTPSFEAIAGVRAAVDYLEELGRQVSPARPSNRRAALTAAYAAIRQHENALMDRFLAGVARLPGWRVWGITATKKVQQRVPTFGLTHHRHPPAQLARWLADDGIFSWHGHFYAPGLIERLGLAPDGLLRIGLLHYNTHEEVQRLLALAEAWEEA
jgi:cysteine desulfurase family protein (TIGR01976 family)